MITFLKNYSLKNTKIKLLILYILNVTDIIFTILLLNTGFYIEANILMLEVVQSPIISFLLKILVPGVLFVFIYFRMQQATDIQLRYCSYLINSAILFYILINALHIIWFALLPVFIFVF
ncbi:DUF5658 family protein [Clostridium beijerinckii]|uniref:DUF5658 family protein n=1 Tax=Clostridium beijerinckii TaxID=1520 RepID=UPI00047DB7CB|nr:DUF5658 family protein [Clostridium beijerinckii]